MDSNNTSATVRPTSKSPLNTCKLSAVMFTDIKGFSRRMGESEKLTLKLLQDHNRILRFLARKHRGKVIKGTGDGYLLDFNSAVEAVQCATEAQERFQRYNANKPECDQIFVRIGLSLGEVMIVEGDLFGDEVNIAARLQTLAEPGGICITREVYERVKSKLHIVAVNLGPQELKNICSKVEVYKIIVSPLGQAAIELPGEAMQPAKEEESTLVVTETGELADLAAVSSEGEAEIIVAEPLVAETEEQGHKPARSRRSRRLLPLLTLSVLLAGLLVINGSWGEAGPSRNGNATIAQAGFMNLEAAQSPSHSLSLAVTYFENRTGAEQDDWLCIGLADMIITELQRGTNLNVLGRPTLHAALTQLGQQKKQSLDPMLSRSVAQKANADLVLCGAVVRQNNVLRLDVQLFNVRTGELLMADREQGENVLQMIESLTGRLQKKIGAAAAAR